MFISILFLAQIMLPSYFFTTTNYYFVVILLEIIPLGIGVWVYLILTKQKLGDIIVFSRPQAKMNKKNMPWLIIMAASMALAGRVFLGGLQLLWIGFLDAVGFAVSDVVFPPVDSVSVFIIALLGIAVTPAIFEELVFRGILQKGLLRSTKPKTAIIISSLMFMLMHLSVESMIFTFACGLILGYMSYKSGSIVPSMAFHFVNNSLAVVGLYLLELTNNLNIGETADLSQYGINQTVYLLIYGVISLGLLVLLLWGFNKLAKSPPANPYLKPMKPVTIVLIVMSGCILFFILTLLAFIQNIIPI